MTFDPAEFEARYGYSAQEYVNRVALSTLRAPKLEAAQAELEADKAKLVPGGWEKLTDQAAMQAGADAENAYLNQVQIVHGLTERQKFAQQFVAGEMAFDAFRSYLGKQANELIDAGVVDGDAVKAALVAAA